MLKNRYHVYRGKRRTTISLSKFLFELLAIKLRTAPNTTAAKIAVRNWLQKKLDKNNDPGRRNASQWLTDEVIDELLDPTLRKTYLAWFMKEYDEEAARRKGHKKKVDN